MQFAYPWGFLGLALIAPLVVAFLARPRATRIEVATLRFWRQAIGDQASSVAGSRWRGRDWFLLAIRVAIVGCLVAALVRPRGTTDVGPLVVIVDNSTSMVAGTVGGTPLDQATRFAKRLASVSQREMAILSGDPKSPLRMEFTNDRGALNATLDHIESMPKTNLRGAIMSAKSLASQRAGARVLLLADGTAPVRDALAEFSDVLVNSFRPDSVENLAITRLSAERSTSDPAMFDVFIEVVNQGDKTVECEIQITLGGELLDVFPIAATARQPHKVSRQYLSTRAGELVASIDILDALNRDNVARVHLSTARRLPVVLVGRPNYFLTSALASVMSVDLQVHQDLPKSIPANSLVVFHQGVPAILPPHHTLVIDPRNSFAGVRLDGLLDDARVAVRDTTDSLLAHVALRGTDFGAPHRLRLSSPYRALASTVSGDPLIAKAEKGGVMRIVLAAELTHGELTRREAFPVFIRNLITATGAPAGNQLRDAVSDESEQRQAEREAESDLAVVPVAGAEALELTAQPYPWLWRGFAIVGMLGLVVESIFARSRGSAIAASVLALSLAAVALLDPSWPRTVSQPSRGVRVFACDMSASVGGQAIAKTDALRSASTELPVDHSFWFGRQPVLEQTGPGAAGGGSGYPELSDASGTNLAAAIRHAASIESVAEIVLVTDGRQTIGDARYAAQSVGVPVSVVPVSPTWRDVWLERVMIPRIVRESEPFSVRAVINANQEATGRVFLRQDGTQVAEATVSINNLDGATRQEIEFPLVLENAQLARIEVVLDNFGDKHIFNNSQSVLVAVVPRRKILCLDHRPETMQPWANALEQQGFAVELISPDQFPTLPGAIAEYAAVVLADVAASDMSRWQQEALKEFVSERGGGLVVLGGERSFGLGGYAASPLVDLLPVSCDFTRTDKMPTLAMILAVDRSSSMEGLRLQTAKQAAKAAITALGDQDRFGLVAFDAAPQLVTALVRPAEAAQSLAQLESTDAGGGTSILSALEVAHDALVQTDAQLKHLVLLTDGHAAPDKLDERVAQMNVDGITISTVAIGIGADQALLADLAELGGGRSFFCSAVTSVPQIISQETVLAAGSAINERVFRPVLVRSSDFAIESLIKDAPPLQGLVKTTAKPFAELLLAHESGEPLLARHQVGLGRVVAFTSDAKPRWAREWFSWSEFGTFWTRLLQWAAGAQRARISMPELIHQNDRYLATCHLADVAGKQNERRLFAEFINDDLTRWTTPMEQVAPRVYEASVSEIANRGKEPQLVLIRTTESFSADVAAARMQTPQASELPATDADVALLRDLAKLSGGRFDPSPREMLSLPTQRRTIHRSFAPWLLLASLCTFVLSTLWRSAGVTGC